LGPSQKGGSCRGRDHRIAGVTPNIPLLRSRRAFHLCSSTSFLLWSAIRLLPPYLSFCFSPFVPHVPSYPLSRLGFCFGLVSMCLPHRIHSHTYSQSALPSYDPSLRCAAAPLARATLRVSLLPCPGCFVLFPSPSPPSRPFPVPCEGIFCTAVALRGFFPQSFSRFLEFLLLKLLVPPPPSHPTPTPPPSFQSLSPSP